MSNAHNKSTPTSIRMDTEYVNTIQPILKAETRALANLMKHALDKYVHKNYPDIAKIIDEHDLTP